MRLPTSTCFASWIVVLVTASSGCSDHDHGEAEPFDTFQLCYDDHHNAEALPVQKAIEICCIDHPIGGDAANVVCGDSAADCQTYLSTNLVDTTDTMLPADIQAACAAYIVDRAK